MEKPLRTLIVEDSEDDYELILRELRRGGYAPLATRVDTPEALDTALEQMSWDIVISDYVMPGFSGLDALKLLQRKGIDVPFILVSGAVGEDIAVAAMRAGAHDYLMKNNLARLVPAIERELKEAAGRRQRRDADARLTEEIAERIQAEESVRVSEEHLRTIIDTNPECIKLLSADGLLIEMNAAGLAMIEADSQDQVIRMPMRGLVLPEHREAFRALTKSVIQGTKGILAFEIQGFKGTRRWLETHAVPMTMRNGETVLLGITRDITERKHADEKIGRLNRTYAVLSGINAAIVRVHDRQELFNEACRIAVEHGQFGMAWIGVLDPKTLDVIPAALAAMTGIDAPELLTMRLNVRGDLLQGQGETGRAIREKTPVFSNDITLESDVGGERREAAIQRGFRSVIALPLQVGEEVVGNLTLFAKEPNFFDAEELKLLTEMAGDISFALDHIEKEERLNYLAYYDVLTGFPNRTLFYDRLNQILNVANEDTTVAVLMVDLERFRIINETLGRHGGDALLKQVAERLRGTGVDVNHLAHTGAGCFAVALVNQKEADVAHILEKRIIDALSRPFMVEGTELRISAKGGIALFPSDGADADTLLRNAEAALKNAKLSGDRYLFYVPQLNARVAETLTLENKLRRALEQEQFVLYYQPKVNLDTGQISGLEALIRWNDPETGLVPPLKFIPLLEETGMILDVGRWALEQAMADSGQWRAQGLLPPRIAVNVSPIQLRHKDFVGTVERVLSGAGNRAAGLELEITESLIMQDIEANIRKLRAVREMGVEVAVDDFGTGYSSLSYLTRLPINALKIDRAFIINMASKADDLSIVATIISLGHSLNLKVIAEGVETEEQANLLRRLKCDEMQGYLFSPAVPAEQIIERLLRENL